MSVLYCTGLHLFNDTRPSGHISSPSQVGFSHSYLCSINKVLWWCSVVGINSTWECRQLVTDLNKELYWIYGLSYQIKESSLSQQLYYASLGDRPKEGHQWVNCVVLITTLLQHCIFQEYVFNGQSLAKMLASSRWSLGQNMGFCGLGMANSEWGYHNKGVCSVPNRPGVSIVCLLGHRGIQNVSHRTVGVWEDSRSLLCARENRAGVSIVCLLHGAQEDLICFIHDISILKVYIAYIYI